MNNHKYTLTIMPDYGYSFAWVKPADDWTTYVGSHTSLADGEVLDRQGVCIAHIPAWLVADLTAWQMYFETDNPDSKPGNDDFCWDMYHVEGLFLAALLQQAVGHSGVVVRYVYPCEDQAHRHCDDIVLEEDACARAKSEYLRRCLPLKHWSFNTLRHSLLAAGPSIEYAQVVLDNAATAWGLDPQPLGLSEAIQGLTPTDNITPDLGLY